MIKVFISYSHDSDEHRERILVLSNRLRDGGIDCEIDQYDPSPEQGWPIWMQQKMQDANYVLLICTETYRKRFEQREEAGKGLGVTWEGMIMQNQLYRNASCSTKFIPIILNADGATHIPDAVYQFSHYDLSKPRTFENLYCHMRGELGATKPPLGKPHFQRTIHSDDLPTVEGELFGRKQELAFLDEALSNPKVHIVQFVASGGTGKTKLIRQWLDDNQDKIEALIAWSFYSQGSGEDKQISATPFFIQALKSLSSDKSVSDFHTEEEKGEYLADLLREKRCLLVLDGLEPLQQVGLGMRGELKDRAIRKMLRCLVGEHSTLCIITTRIPVHELQNRRQVVQHDLQNLAAEDGVALLRSFGVTGRNSDIVAAVEEYGHHALALHLLANALTTYLDADVRKRDTLTELIGDYDDVERHAFKVMQAYQHWLTDTPELKLLYLLGLFDHPVEQEVLEVLWEAEIPGLTEGVLKKAWLVARRDLLQKFRMMSEHEGVEGLFDCHPLIREYFGRQLKESQAEVWRQAHTVLYEYYKSLPEKLYGKYLPDTLEEMQPLFKAVTHGCLSGNYEETWGIFSERLERNPKNYSGAFYLSDTLNAWKDGLSLIANYFSEPWNNLCPMYSAVLRSNIYNRAASYLDTLGRYPESINVQTKAVHEARNDVASIGSAVINSYSLSLTLIQTGSLNKAYQNALDTRRLSQQVNQPQADITSLSTLGRILHLQGRLDESSKAFQAAERVQMLSSMPFLHSVGGAHYCELLLDLNRPREVRSRSAKCLKVAGSEYTTLSIFLDQLNICKAWILESHINQATSWLNKSKSSLNKLDILYHLADYQQVLFKLHQIQKKHHSAFQVLKEIYEIAEPSKMRLHLTDYHIEMARLILAVEADPNQYPEATPDRTARILPFADQDEPGILTLEGHINEGAKLIEETGYHRRDAELAELKNNRE